MNPQPREGFQLGKYVILQRPQHVACGTPEPELRLKRFTSMKLKAVSGHLVLEVSGPVLGHAGHLTVQLGAVVQGEAGVDECSANC